MFDEDDLVPIGALQHFVFCERQCSLIFRERIWLDNELTVSGSLFHTRPDEGSREVRGDLLVFRAVPLRSARLGITGRADVIEFQRVTGAETGVTLPRYPGLWQPVPVEYKRGRPNMHRADEVQVCAQAMCLEEMFGIEVPKGALYYGVPRRRTDVFFDASLRGLVEETVQQVRQLLQSERAPPPRISPACDSCSLKPICLPNASPNVSAYIDQQLGTITATRDR